MANPTVEKKKIGLFMATMIVIVNMVGTGIFMLPASMASIGSISLYGWIIATIGATGIGIVYAVLGSVQPKDGGPYAYARDSLGPFLGFQTNYIYWTANLIGNIAVAATITGYVVGLFPGLHGFETFCTIALIWMATGVNIVGPRCVGISTSWATAIGIIPLVFIALAGWYWFDGSLYIKGWNPHHDTSWTAISQSVTFALWAYMGIESAAVDSSVIENAKRNVPLATIIGLIISAILYIGTCTVLMGIVPMEELANSSDPFSVAALKIFGPVGAIVMGACAILKGGASLVGWTLNISESAAAAAKDGLFPRIYSKVNRSGVPVWNFGISAILMTLIVFATISPTLNQQFNEIIDMAVILVVLPYLYSVVSYLECEFGKSKYRWGRVGAVAVATVASVYCLWVVFGSEATLVRSAMLILLICIPLYPIFERRILKKETVE